MLFRSKSSPAAASLPDQIITLQRGGQSEVYRLRLLPSGAASLQRFEGGSYGPERIFDGHEGEGGFDARAPNSRQKMRGALRYVIGFLDGAVNVGERDLLSPTSAFSRNVRWFPGDIQMLHTAFPYVSQLFPSAQFHLSQLFRRVLGDASFLAFVLATSAFWLRAEAPSGVSMLAVGLQVVSMVAIIGLDRYWEPIRFRLRQLAQLGAGPHGALGWLAAPWVLVSQLWRGSCSMLIGTLIGLANVVVHPGTILQMSHKVRAGKTLEWKASSMSAGQDLRGWPLAEFTRVYAPAMRVGALVLCVVAWAWLLGAPIELLGLNGLGVFVASFLTAFLYAWYAALPFAADSGAPLYRLRAREWRLLSALGAIGLALSLCLWRYGAYPLPAFEGSVGYVFAFLTLSALFALLYPTYYAVKLHVFAGAGVRGRRRWRLLRLACLALLLAGAIALQASGGLRIEPIAPLWQAMRRDEASWRMPEPERRVLAAVHASMHRDAQVELAPPLRAEGDQVALRASPGAMGVELAELRAVPRPKLQRIRSSADALDIPTLYALPLPERLAVGKPQRRYSLPIAEPSVRAPLPLPAGQRVLLAARRRAAAVTPRWLSPAELDAQREFVRDANYPWLERATLQRMAEPDESGRSVPLLELARVQRWGEIERLWSSVHFDSKTEAIARIKFLKLGVAVDAVAMLGLDPAPEPVRAFLALETRLIESWSVQFPRLPFASTSPAPGRSRFTALAEFASEHRLEPDALARLLRLDYVDTYWDAPASAPTVQRVFSERPRSEPWEQLTLDWDGNEALRERFEALITEQAVAMKLWRSGGGAGPAPTAQQLRAIVAALERVLDGIVRGERSGPYAALADVFRLEGVDGPALQRNDTAAALLASRIWTQTMAGRLARAVANVALDAPLPGSAADRVRLGEASRERYPDDGGDPELRRVFEWLVLVDAEQTYREMAAGYDEFMRAALERGTALDAPQQAARLDPGRVHADMLLVMRELQRRHPRLPALDDQVAEFLCHTAYFSSRDGKLARTPVEFLDDFADRLAAVEALMAQPPPEVLQWFAERQLERSEGRRSRSARARRFFAWWMVVQQTRVVQHNYALHGLSRAAQPVELARAWAGIIASGDRRWPQLPWFHAGFAEFFLNVQLVRGLPEAALFSAFERQLTAADALMARHVVPAQAFEDLVDRRIADKTQTPNFDPVLRRANALLALAQLLDVMRRNRIGAFVDNPALASQELAGLHERLTRDYPALYWNAEGVSESYFLLGLAQGWDRAALLRRFEPEWTLANALAQRGWLRRFELALRRDPSALGADELALRGYAEVQALRLEEATAPHPRNPKLAAMNALGALSTLLLGAGEEGLMPSQQGQAWSRARVEGWAREAGTGRFTAADAGFAQALLGQWWQLLQAMRAQGPRFPWHRGSIVEANLLAMRGAGVEVAALARSMAGSWKAASDLVAAQTPIPPAFERVVLQDTVDALRQRLAAARGVPIERVASSEVAPDDPELVRLDATLALADSVADVRAKFAIEPDAVALGQRIAEVRVQGPLRYPNLPWSAKGFVPAMVVAAWGDDFRDDFFRYAQFIDAGAIDALLGATCEPQPGREGSGCVALPPEVLQDVRATLRERTGRSPASAHVVAFQAVRDGVFLLKEFLPQRPRDLPHVLAITTLRAAIRNQSAAFPELHIARDEQQQPRVGFADRLAVLAMKRGLERGAQPAEPQFASAALELMRRELLVDMNRIYARVRQSFWPEELQHHRQQRRYEAELDNARRAQKHGLSVGALSVAEPDVDDVIADAALYEMLYAKEIGRGAGYVEKVFDVLAALRARPHSRALFSSRLAEVDQPQLERIRPLDALDFEQWRADPAYPGWLATRATLIERERGRAMALARTFALIDELGFGDTASAQARASFARFGNFEAYLQTFLADFELVRQVPEFAAAIAALERRDPFLADGVHFALAAFQTHVVDHSVPDPQQAAAVLRGIAAQLPRMQRDFGDVLGFEPALESGVALYDARVAFLRGRLEAGAGADLLRRMRMTQRGVSSWTQAYLLKQAYRVLFRTELDEEDPTPVPRSAPLLASAAGWPRSLAAITAHLPRLWPAFATTRGEQVREFLQTRLPERLKRETGSSDPRAFIDWLEQHGELALDGSASGGNPYRDEVASFERRIAHYRARVDAGRAAGDNTRAEERRIADLQREYSSLQGQVAALHEAAAAAPARVQRARRDYREAIWLHCGLLLVLVIGCGVLARALARRIAPSWAWLRGALAWGGVLLPLLLGTGACVVASAWPQLAARAPHLAFERLRLLERGLDGRLERRGAAAQIGRSCGLTHPRPSPHLPDAIGSSPRAERQP